MVSRYATTARLRHSVNKTRKGRLQNGCLEEHVITDNFRMNVLTFCTDDDPGPPILGRRPNFDKNPLTFPPAAPATERGPPTT